MRYSRRVRTLCLGGLGLATALAANSTTSAWAASPEGRPVAVSPGDATKVALIRDDCPTFSWGEVEGAKSYDLVVYRLPEEGEEEQEQPVLHETFPGSASSWTPSLDRCLERGGEYAWSVRAVGPEESSEWSSPSLFQVAAGPSEAEFEEALAVVRQYLAEEATGSVGALASSGVARTGSSPSAPQVSGVPPPNAASSGGDAALQVNGSPVVTVASFSFALCGARGLRYLDQGDGTVLDCNTGLIWLKDASCLGHVSWTSSGSSGTFGRTLLFNLGLLTVSCTDYSIGTYSDWRVPTIGEFCSQDAPTPTVGLCPTSSVGDSLVNTNFSDPALSNATGAGGWVEDDAFVGVLNGGYWSATEADTDNAWAVGFSNGLVTPAGKFNLGSLWLVRGGQ